MERVGQGGIRNRLMDRRLVPFYVIWGAKFVFEMKFGANWREGVNGMNQKKKKNSLLFRRYLPIYLLMATPVAYLLINNYLPMVGLQLAFKQYSLKKGVFGSDWIGLSNFEFLFASEDAWKITRNTVGYNLAFIILGTVFAIFVAVLLAEVKGKRAIKLYQTVVLYPYLISILVVAYLLNAFLAGETGFLNKVILEPLGFEGVSWYSTPKYWPFILVFVHLWKNSGYNIILYLSTINSIDKGYYEAAALDGASRWQQFCHITLPSLKPTIITLTLLAVGRVFYSDFGLFYQVPLNSGALIDVTNTIDTYVYRGLMELGNIGMSSAAGFFQSIVGFVFVLLANYIVKKISPEDAMF